jgi:hypothetical protein
MMNCVRVLIDFSATCIVIGPSLHYNLGIIHEAVQITAFQLGGQIV